MDAGRFDTLARILASRGSRRQAAGGLLGGLLFRVLTGVPVSANSGSKKKARKKRAKPTNRQQDPAPARQERAGKKRDEQHNRRRNKRKARNRQRQAKESRPNRQTDQPPSHALAAAAGLPEIDYFALGDSIASGHGLNDDGNGCIPNGTTCCRRSARSYPSKVNALLSEHYVVHFHHLACSGATALRNLPGQIDETLRLIKERNKTPELRGRPTLISITIGANDLEWLNLYNLTDRFIFSSDARWIDFVEDRVERTAKVVTLMLRRLIAVEGVRVVLTGVHDPFNSDPGPWFARLARQFWPRDGQILTLGLSIPCGLIGADMDCAERADYAVTQLNDALNDVLRRLNADEQARVLLAQAAFVLGQHEAPQGWCGAEPPTTVQTWVQYPYDPNSNSDPYFEIKVGQLARVIQWPGGDCFHPNEKGATAYANAVYDDAVRLGFDGEILCEDGEPSCRGICCPEFWVCDEGTCANCGGEACCYEDSCRGIPLPGRDPNPLAYCSSTGANLCVNDAHLCDGPRCGQDDDCQEGAYCLNRACCEGISRCIVRVSCGS